MPTNATCLSNDALCRIIGLSTLLLVTTVLGCEHPKQSSDNKDASAEARVVVRTVPVQKRSIARTVDALGRCDAVPEHEALLTPIIEGRIDAILVQQGAQVTAGQPIVQLDATLAKADLAEKQATRDSLVAALELLKSLPREKEQEASGLAIQQAKIAVSRAQAVVERLRPLRARNEISEQQFFEAEQALAQAVVQQQTAEAQFDVLMLPPRPEAIAEAEARIKAADEVVATSQTRLRLLTISAPIDGFLDRLTCHLGQTIPVGADAGTIVDTRQMLVIIWLSASSSELVQVGQTAEVRASDEGTAATSSTSRDEIWKGPVVFKGRLADLQTGNIPIHVLVENPENKLVIGQTVEVVIGVEQSASTLAVPQAAIHDEGEGPVLTVVRDEKTVVLHPLLGAVQDGWTTVAGSDLREGEPVVIEGAYNLPPGTTVKTETADETRHERE